MSPRLRPLTAEQREEAQALYDHMTRLRASGVTWRRMAYLLGVRSEQAAHSRYRGLARRLSKPE